MPELQLVSSSAINSALINVARGGALPPATATFVRLNSTNVAISSKHVCMSMFIDSAVAFDASAVLERYCDVNLLDFCNSLMQ